MHLLVFGVIAVIAAIYGVTRLASMEPAAAARQLRRVGQIGLVLFGIFFLLRGQIGPALGLFGAAGAMIVADAARRARVGAGNRPDARRRRSAMTADEARAVLGVSETADEEDIKAAYRRLMQNLHPDAGGTDYLAAQINDAKDVLLKDAKGRWG